MASKAAIGIGVVALLLGVGAAYALTTKPSAAAPNISLSAANFTMTEA